MYLRWIIFFAREGISAICVKVEKKITVLKSKDWVDIQFEATSQNSIFDYVFINYASTKPIDVADGATVDITDTVDYFP